MYRDATYPRRARAFPNRCTERANDLISTSYRLLKEAACLFPPMKSSSAGSPSGRWREAIAESCSKVPLQLIDHVGSNPYLTPRENRVSPRRSLQHRHARHYRIGRRRRPDQGRRKQARPRLLRPRHSGHPRRTRASRAGSKLIQCPPRFLETKGSMRPLFRGLK